MILSIIVLLDILAALSALLGLADFFDNAEVLSKIVLKEDKNRKSLDDNEETEFLHRSNNNGINRELVKTTSGEDRSGEMEADSFFGQSDLIYLMNTTADGEIMDPRGEVAIIFSSLKKEGSNSYNQRKNFYHIS